VSKGTQREINRVTISARGASIGDGDDNELRWMHESRAVFHSDGSAYLVVRGVGNSDLSTTKVGSQAEVPVTISVYALVGELIAKTRKCVMRILTNSCDQIVVAMNSAACSRVAILIKVCGATERW
jgi:hypothetical protein